MTVAVQFNLTRPIATGSPLGDLDECAAASCWKLGPAGRRTA